MTPILSRGERAPDMVLPTAGGTQTRLYATAGGRPGVLVLAGEDSAPALHTLVAELASAGDALSVHVIGPAGVPDLGDRVTTFVDAEGRAAQAYRTGGAATAFVLDANLRVRSTFALDDGARVAAQVLALLPELTWNPGEATVIASQAPLLVVPDVLGPNQCAELMEVWESEGSTATGVEASAGGSRSEQLSATFKRRRDHVVEDPERTRELVTAVGRRVIPEISKAFAYKASRFEGFKIACYEASDRGFFKAHRDNLSPSTAHRRFALTLNLNDDYEGGQLRFPEYGPDLYRPRPGAALIFSCSHLHEVLDVTAGRRFVLLSFLFGAEAPRQ